MGITTKKVVEDIVGFVLNELWDYDGFRHMMDDIECSYEEFADELTEGAYRDYQDKNKLKLVPVEGQNRIILY